MTPNRTEFIETLFPEGIPTLWCPPLTHFDSTGSLDERRIAAHLSFLTPWVKGLLVPGTTGEGWELSDSEISKLLRLVLPLASKLHLHVLVGVLKPTSEEMVDTARRMLRELGHTPEDEGLLDALHRIYVAGFTFCAPRGKDLSQSAIASGLRGVLELGLPSALYQLPQVTGNEISPQTASDLASRFENLLLLKDSSGNDRILASGTPLDDLFLVRGAEGEYFRWHHGRQPRYDGFLLSSANCFPRQLAEIASTDGQPDRLEALSATITQVIDETFDVVGAFERGNAFTNANKAIDHFNAFGSKAHEAPEPRLHDGTIIPRSLLARVEEILKQHDLLPTRGYLEGM